MKKYWVVKLFEIVLLLLIIIAGFGQAVLQLWNWLMPDIFGLRPITFWQAVGLMGLSYILFGGFRGSSYGNHWRWSPRNQRMTPEQRDRVRAGLQGPGCGR